MKRFRENIVDLGKGGQMETITISYFGRNRDILTQLIKVFLFLILFYYVVYFIFLIFNLIHYFSRKQLIWLIKEIKEKLQFIQTNMVIGKNLVYQELQEL